jgi:hypothetical protein
MSYSKQDDHFFMEAREIEAGKILYKRYSINRFELNMLCSLAAYLQVHNKKTVSRKLLTDWIGMAYKTEKRAWAYIQGLITKGAVHLLTWRNQKPGTGNSLGISPLGGKILSLYWSELERIEKRDRSRKQNPSYETHIFEEPPEGYTTRQLGRSA